MKEGGRERENAVGRWGGGYTGGELDVRLVMTSLLSWDAPSTLSNF